MPSPTWPYRLAIDRFIGRRRANYPGWFGRSRQRSNSVSQCSFDSEGFDDPDLLHQTWHAASFHLLLGCFVDRSGRELRRVVLSGCSWRHQSRAHHNVHSLMSPACVHYSNLSHGLQRWLLHVHRYIDLNTIHYLQHNFSNVSIDRMATLLIEEAASPQSSLHQPLVHKRHCCSTCL